MTRTAGLAAALIACALSSKNVAAEPLSADDLHAPPLATQLRQQWAIEDVAPQPEDPATLKTRDDTLERLSLRDAVAAALENNPGIAAERLGPLFARTDIERANGVFDPVLEADATIDRSVNPSGSALAGASVVRTRDNAFGLSIRKLLRTGATLTIAGDSTETDTNSRFVGLRPQYKPTLTFSIDQPLLRNFGIDLTILLVRSAEATSSMAYYRYQSAVAALVRRVVEAYWGVVQASESLEVEQGGLKLAQTLVRENEARVRAGTLAMVAVKEAKADAATRDGRVIAAENALAVANDGLRLLLQRNPTGAFLPRPIEPTDRPEVRDLPLDDQEILEHAVASRPELQQARYDIENRKILAKVKRNNLLPGLDLRASYGLGGLAGRGVAQTDVSTGETVLTAFTGSYGKALDRLSSNDFNSYSAGVAFRLALGNGTAEAEYVQSRIDVRRGDLAYKDLLADVTLEVRRAVGDVRTHSKRITATRLARELAAENLADEHKRYGVGLVTTKDILDFQARLTAARAAEIRALIDYNVALAALRQAEGTLLGEFDIVLDTLPPSPSPLWSRF